MRGSKGERCSLAERRHSGLVRGANEDSSHLGFVLEKFLFPNNSNWAFTSAQAIGFAPRARRAAPSTVRDCLLLAGLVEGVSTARGHNKENS